MNSTVNFGTTIVALNSACSAVTTPTFSHLRYDLRATYDHATDGDQLVNILRIQVTHVLSLLNVKSSHLNLKKVNQNDYKLDH